MTPEQAIEKMKTIYKKGAVNATVSVWEHGDGNVIKEFSVYVGDSERSMFIGRGNSFEEAICNCKWIPPESHQENLI